MREPGAETCEFHITFRQLWQAHIFWQLDRTQATHDFETAIVMTDNRALDNAPLAFFHETKVAAGVSALHVTVRLSTLLTLPVVFPRVS